MPVNSLRVLIVGTSFGFPYGQGATARVYMYAKALRSAGAEVRVASLLLPQTEGPNAESPFGTFDGIPYEYPCGAAGRPGSFLARRLLKARRLLRLYYLIHVMASGAPGRSAVLIYAGSWTWVATLMLMAHRAGAAALLDLCELPRPRGRRGLRSALYRVGQWVFPYLPLDGIIPISTYLEGYVAAGPRPTATLLVPVMVDVDAFDPSSGRPASVEHATERRRIVYCGALGKYEEVQRAVKAFVSAAADVPGAELLLVGYGPPERVALSEGLVRDLGVEDRVHFIGDVPRDELPQLYADAEVFVLPRPPSVIAAAGLPNKLGEYLAAGRPVVVGANGDIPLYLEDGVDAYVVDPSDEAAFAARLRHVLDHRDEAAAVGARGREAAVGEFDYRVHGPRLAEFVAGLAARRGKKAGA